MRARLERRGAQDGAALWVSQWWDHRLGQEIGEARHPGARPGLPGWKKRRHRHVPIFSADVARGHFRDHPLQPREAQAPKAAMVPSRTHS